MDVDDHDEPPKQKGLPPVAKIVCGAALVLSAGLVIPFLFAKRRAALPPTTLHLSNSTVSSFRLSARASESNGNIPPLRLRKTEAQFPQEGEQADTIGAIKHAFKALGVATTLVAAGTGTAFAGVTLGLGITTIGEFQTVMRSVVRSTFPQLHAQLHSTSDPATAQYYPTEMWDRERVDNALEDALQRGGWREWVQEARRQLERERAVQQRMAEIERDR